MSGNHEGLSEERSKQTMIHILLICSGGMSTSLLAKRMQDVANRQKIAVEVSAIGDFQTSEFVNQADLILLGPQIRFRLHEIQSSLNYKIPVMIIDWKVYGLMDGEQVLQKALAVIQGNE